MIQLILAIDLGQLNLIFIYLFLIYLLTTLYLTYFIYTLFTKKKINKLL